jgi:uncharacterized protein (TIRG00374 family)
VRIPWRGALGVVLSVGLLVWVLRDVDIAEVWRILRASNLWLFLLSSVVATAIFPLRAIRWQVILSPVAGKLPFGPPWRAVAIGMMINNVVPARVGEIARAYALSREVPAVRFPAALASLAVDRVFDAIIVGILLVASTMVPGFPAGAEIAGQPVTRFALVFGLLMLGLVAALIAIAAVPAQIARLYEFVVGRVAPGLVEPGERLITSFASGLTVLHSPSRFLLVFWWTLVHWLANALAFYIAFFAVGVDAPFSAALFAQGIIVIGVALPSTPGFFGVFEAAATVALGLFGIGAAQAVSWAIGFHLVSFIPITVIGAIYFARLGLRLQDVRRTPAAGAA